MSDKPVDPLLKAIERFDDAAMLWGWESDQGTTGVEGARVEYEASKNNQLTNKWPE